MIVKQLLSGRRAEDIATISEANTLGEAAKRLTERKIGALIVRAEGGGVAGILSERDIVRRVAADGAGALDGEVGATMTANVVTCAPADNTDQLLSQMTDGRFRHMPVLEEGQLVGIVSIGDVVKARISEIEMENKAMEDMIRGV